MLYFPTASLIKRKQCIRHEGPPSLCQSGKGRAGTGHWRWHPSRTMSPKQFPLSLNPHCQLQKPLQRIHLAGLAAVFPLAALCYLYKLTYPQAQRCCICLQKEKQMQQVVPLSMHRPSRAEHLRCSRACFGLQEGWERESSPSSSCGHDTGCQGWWQWPCCPFHLHVHDI